MEISSRPTDAQESIVKSLIKVILHQVNASGSYELSEGQENLLISLCVEKLQVETVCENTNLPCSEGSLTEKIEDIFAKVESDGSDTSILKNTFHIRFYCCMDDQDLNTTTNNVMEEFDKIDIQDPSNRGEDDERTLTSTNPALMGLPISQETATQTEIQLLPSADYDGLWEALHFDCNIKQRLFSYATISLKLSQFSRKCVSEALVSNNKLLLVHGPPGTGKTTVCKALCQKLSIRHYQKNVKAFDIADYRAIIVEISCSRIFSRWFGESAKNLDSIFKDIEKLLIQNADQSKFVCLLMDEVETIASSRSSQMNKNETTDGVRVVNTLLTQLDNLKRYNNLLVLATSNLVESLDPAFVDRADGIFFIGTPSEEGTSIILSSTIRELIRAK